MIKLKSAILVALILSVFCPKGIKAAPAVATIYSHNISVSVDLSSGTLTGSDELQIDGQSRTIVLFLRSASAIHAIKSGTRALRFRTQKTADKNLNMITINPGALEKTDRLRTISIMFSGKFKGADEAAKSIKRGVAYFNDGFIGPEDAVLPSSSNWYPREEGLSARTTIAAVVPNGYTAVSNGKWVSSINRNNKRTDTWLTDNPADGADLIVSRFFAEKENYRGVDLYTFFLQKDAGLSRTYIEKSKHYLDKYERAIGPYPYPKFAVVEGALPTGYGMPSFTLLGSSVLRLPFIPDTSLGHEIAHNWWGNSVFLDESGGNWTEAVTTFVADYAYAEEKGTDVAAEFRSSKLAGFKGFSSGQGALKDFKDSTEAGARSVGYNKGFFVFMMLRQEIGEEAFAAGLKRFYNDNKFRRANWADIRRAFEASSGKDLGWFFSQWIGLPGAPSLKLEKAGATQYAEGKYVVRFGVTQGLTTYRLNIPVRIGLKNNAPSSEVTFYDTTITLDSAEKEFSIQTSMMPVSIELDAQNTVFRILDDEETPPTVSGFLSDKAGAILIPEEGKDGLTVAAEAITKDYPKEIVAYPSPRADNLVDSASTLIVINSNKPNESSAAEKIINRISKDDGRFFNQGKETLTCLKNPKAASKTTCVLTSSGGPEIVLDTIRRLRYFGDWSRLIFSGKKVVEKTRSKGLKVLYSDL